MKRKCSIFILVAFAIMILSPFIAPAYADESDKNTEAINEKLGVPIVVYGATLSASQKDEVKRLLNVSNAENTEEYSVSGADAETYINGNPNSRMFSSAKITLEEEGKGINIDIVTPNNITQVTVEMYMNALLTAGVEDATVEVASPVPVSGHSALTGIYKAYDEVGIELDKERMELADEELDMATDLANKEGMSNEKVSELFTEIKKEIADQDPATKEDIERIVKEQMDKLNIELSEKDFDRLAALFEKMRSLDIDFGKVKKQLNDLTGKVKDKLKDLGLDEGFWTKVIDFFKKIIEAIIDFFNNLMN